jgi:hypothetical protein
MAETALETRKSHLIEQHSSAREVLIASFFEQPDLADQLFQTRRFNIEVVDAPILETLNPADTRQQRIQAGRPTLVTVPEAWYTEPNNGPQRGLEVEVDFARPYYQQEPDIKAFMNHADTTVQQLGFLIGYDSLREMILPPGNTTANMATIAELINFGLIIPEEHTVGIHINVDDIKNPTNNVPDILLCDLMAELAGLFDAPDRGYKTPTYARKRLIEAGVAKHPLTGFPVVIRDNNVVEFRNLCGGAFDFNTFTEDFQVFDHLVTELGAYSNSEETQTWSRKKELAIQLIDSVFIPRWGYSIDDYLLLIGSLAQYELHEKQFGPDRQLEQALQERAQIMFNDKNVTLEQIRYSCLDFDKKLALLALDFEDNNLSSTLKEIVAH